MTELDPVLAITSGLRTAYGERRWVIAMDVLQAATAMVARLQAYGSTGCFVVAARRGTGVEPEAPYEVLGLPPMPMMEAIRTGEDALRALPLHVEAAIDAFDPELQAQVLGSIFSDGRPVAGRPFYGARPAAWQELEDKVVIDQVWDETDVERAPAEVVPIDEGALRLAAERLDRGAGTVWAGDASQGFHGGGAYTFSVQRGDDVEPVVARLRTRSRTARVMPFLEGIPCSIHGIVLPHHVVVLRPAELVVLRGPKGFVYGRAATFWDPPTEDRAEMRRIARRVGQHLRRTHGYRGAFTIDGVLTEQGFRPTELNPRVGAALGLMHPHIPFDLFNAALIERQPFDLFGAALEATILASADRERRGMLAFVLGRPINETVEHALCFRGGRWVVAADGEVHDGIARVGPGSTGGYAALRLNPLTTPVGESVAPRAAAFAAWLDETYGAGIGTLIPSLPLR